MRAQGSLECKTPLINWKTINQSDIKSAKSKKGGRRHGSGRPKGRLSDLNQQRLEAKQQFIDRVNKMVDPLFNAQAALAMGVSYLYRVDQDDKGNALPAERVTDPQEIRQYIDHAFDNQEGAYYFITTERPDNKALDSMLNRAFGKPDEHIDLTSKGERIVGGPQDQVNHQGARC